MSPDRQGAVSLYCIDRSLLNHSRFRRTPTAGWTRLKHHHRMLPENNLSATKLMSVRLTQILPSTPVAGSLEIAPREETFSFCCVLKILRCQRDSYIDSDSIRGDE